MIIKGFQKLTLLDYPGRTACTVFTGGCNLLCPFCHNAGLVTMQEDGFYTEEEIFEHLKKRKNVIDGVAVTGGEPLLQKDIESFLYEIKDLGYSVKLDTNGTFPERLKDIISIGLADYVAMDIKNSKSKYGITVGKSDFNIEPVEKSVDILMNGSIDYEFRTTVTGTFHTVEDIKSIGEWIKGAKHYYLQNFVDSGNLIDGTVTGVKKSLIYKMADEVKELVESVEVRGI